MNIKDASQPILFSSHTYSLSFIPYTPPPSLPVSFFHFTDSLFLFLFMFASFTKSLSFTSSLCSFFPSLYHQLFLYNCSALKESFMQRDKKENSHVHGAEAVMLGCTDPHSEWTMISVSSIFSLPLSFFSSPLLSSLCALCQHINSVSNLLWCVQEI